MPEEHPHALCLRAIGTKWLAAFTLLAVLFAGTWGATAADAGAATAIASRSRTLRGIQDIYALTAAERAEPQDVDMEIHVAYVDSSWKLLWAESDGVSLFIPRGTSLAQLNAGDVIRLHGTWRPSETLSLSDLPIELVAANRPFSPAVVDDTITDSVRLNTRMVRVNALVERQIVTDANHLTLHLIVGGHPVLSRLLLGNGDPVPALAGRMVTLDGVYTTIEDPALSSFVAQIWIGRADYVQPREFLNASPLFAGAQVMVSQLADAPPGQRVRLAGQVADFVPGRGFTLVDPTGRIQVFTAQTLGIADDQAVEVYGQPFRTPERTALARPLVRPKGGNAATASSTGAREKPENPADLPLLTSLHDYWSVDASQKDTLHRFAFDIRINYFDAEWNLLWCENGPDVAFINVDKVGLDFHTGQVVRLEGLHRPSEPFTLRSVEKFTTLKDYSTPAGNIPAIDGDISMRSDLDSRIVQITGLVERQDDNITNHLQLDLLVDGYRIEARARLTNQDTIPDLVGRMISVEGVFVPRGPNNEAFVADLWIGRMSTIRVTTDLAQDPRFNINATPIENLGDAGTAQPVRIVGEARLSAPGRSVTIRDATGQISVRTVQTLGIKDGEMVDLLGIPMKEGLDWTVTRPIFRPANPDDAGVSARTTVVLQKLRTADQVISLLPTAAGQSRPVRLVRAVVTWSHPESPFFFVRDSSGSVQVMRPPGGAAPPTPATRVNVTGTSALGPFAPIIMASSFELFSNSTLPEARSVTVEQAMTGVEEAQRIELSGFVREVRHQPPWTILELTASGGEFRAQLPIDAGLDVHKDTIVSVRGICTAVANDRRQLTGIDLLASGDGDITADNAAAADPFDSELRQIAGLRQFSPQKTFGRRIRIRGTVLLHIPGRYIVINEDQVGIVAFSHGTTPLVPGDLIDVVGIPSIDGPRTVMRESTYRLAGEPSQQSPVQLNSTSLVDDQFDCRLVELDATLVDASYAENSFRLNMICEGTTFAATLEAFPPNALPTSKLLPGSVLRLTGVYRVGYNDDRLPTRFDVQLRTPGDIIVRTSPPWFTAERARLLAAALAAFVGVAIGWAQMLRIRVRKQTRQIRQQLIKEARLEDRQRNIIEKASDFIFMLDLSGSFTLFNPAGEAMTGYSREEVPRLTIYDLIDENDRIGLRTALLKARPESELQPFQTQFRRKDSTLIWVEVAIRYLVEDDRVSGALCVARDITERKAVEEELKRARDAAEANTKAKSAFLANMSHEIRTPMNGVIGMSNLLLDTSLSHDQRDFALTIRNSAEALLTVLNDILDFSKIEAGKLQFETLDFDLREAVDDTLDLLAARAASKHLELAALIPTTLPQKLRGDPGRLRQVLLNLLGNAIKFTEKGEVSISASLERETRTGFLIRFEVKDSGIGITPEEQQKLFMPFSQADASTTRKYGGTGLGLAICHQIVEQMNGQIGVRSETGRGSVFWFTIELARGDAAPLEPRPETLRGQRMLGVDDNQINRTVLQHYLEPAGVRLDLASNAQEALGMLRAAAAAGDPFRLVLLDYHMPEMDGLALARAIHTDTRFRGLAMALLTSVDRRFTAAELEAIGITASMAKPIRQRELIHTIQRALNSDTAPETPPVPHETATSTPLPPLRVLVAEDNPVNQRLTRIQLKKLGYEADLACNGLEVLEAFDRVRYDVIFMDCQMPELDGYDTARRLASHPRRGDVRIVAMTANAMQGDRDKCIESGMDDYLSKPTRPDELTAALSRAAEAIVRPD